MTTRSKRILLGLLMLGAIGLLAAWVGAAVPLIPPLVVAIVIGASISNTVGTPSWAAAGINTHSQLLETAIVLLGASLSVEAIVTAGPLLVGLVVVIVVFGLVMVELLARLADLNERLSSLLAAGSSICGVSAVAATSPTCNAEEGQIAHAAATILLFDAVTLVVFPPIGRTLGLDSQVFGIWIGLAMFSTGPVAAAGFTHSAIAGKWATLTKLTRNALIGFVAIGYSIRYSDNQAKAPADASLSSVWEDFPKFLIGFLALAVLTSSGVIPAKVVTALSTTSDVLFLVAFAGLGFDIRVREMQTAGIRSVLVVGTYLLVVSFLTLLVVLGLF